MRVRISFMRFRDVCNRGPGAIALYVISQLVFTVVLVVAILFLVKGIFKSSEPYKHSIGVIETNPEVMRSLGDNYRQTGFIFGSIRVSGKNGSADFSYRLRGMSGISKVKVTAIKASGSWIYTVIDFYPDARGSDVVNLLKQ